MFWWKWHYVHCICLRPRELTPQADWDGEWEKRLPLKARWQGLGEKRQRGLASMVAMARGETLGISNPYHCFYRSRQAKQQTLSFTTQDKLVGLGTRNNPNWHKDVQKSKDVRLQSLKFTNKWPKQRKPVLKSLLTSDSTVSRECF